ncbi:sirohydrochlorin chelatase [Pontibacillus salicampi]|uniref:Sirohydrochlorin chelatase n=1 Tax=Pontibacillus salicampi TaxID=1449801 RepID=A0ABV6LUE2_9BACI
MQAILYVCHGSRVAEGRRQAVSFVEQCQESVDAPIQEICFLELADPTIEQGITACVEKGATHIAVIPILLLTATHAKHDIPEEVDNMKSRYPHVHFQYGAPFGVHRRIVDILVERIQEQGKRIEDDDMILLVGRGSSDPDVKKSFASIEGYVQAKTGVHHIQTCFLAAADPSFEEGLEIAKQSQAKRVFVLPYLLFTGVLMGEMTEAIEALDTHKEFVLCQYLGYHDNLRDVLQDRVKEAINA